MLSINNSVFQQKPKTIKRIYLLDELRGFAILLMVAYHGFFTVGFLYDISIARQLFVFFEPVEPLFAGLFIFICGISCRLSHNNWKRGGLLLLVALCITVFLWLFLPDELILFGILHFLATAILLYALLRPLLDKIPPIAGLLICGLLMLLTWWIPVYQGSIVGIKGLLEWPVPDMLKTQVWLYPIGFSIIECSDYFPILPWIFCFLAGSFCGVWARAGQFPSWTYAKRVPFLDLIGRHTLIIYIVHQPIIYAVCYLIYIAVKAING